MSTLATIIRDRAETGSLNYLSLAFIGGRWSAVYRGVDGNDTRHGEDSDPVAALIQALGGDPHPPRTSRRRPRGSQPFDDLLG